MAALSHLTWGDPGHVTYLSTLCFFLQKRKANPPLNKTIVSRDPAMEGTRQTLTKCGFPSVGYFTHTVKGITKCISHRRKLIWGQMTWITQNHAAERPEFKLRPAWLQTATLPLLCPTFLQDLHPSHLLSFFTAFFPSSYNILRAVPLLEIKTHHQDIPTHATT